MVQWRELQGAGPLLWWDGDAAQFIIWSSWLDKGRTLRSLILTCCHIFSWIVLIRETWNIRILAENSLLSRLASSFISRFMLTLYHFTVDLSCKPSHGVGCVLTKLGALVGCTDSRDTQEESTISHRNSSISKFDENSKLNKIISKVILRVSRASNNSIFKGCSKDKKTLELQKFNITLPH